MNLACGFGTTPAKHIRHSNAQHEGIADLRKPKGGLETHRPPGRKVVHENGTDVMLLVVAVKAESLTISQRSDHLDAIAQAAHGKRRWAGRPVHPGHSCHRATHRDRFREYAQCVAVV